MKYLILLMMVVLAGCATSPTTPTQPTDPVVTPPVTTTPETPVVTEPTTPVVIPPVVVEPTPPVIVTPPVVVTPEPPVVVPPVVIPESPKLWALDSFNAPTQDTINWKTEITRTIFKNQATGFVVKGDLCLLVGVAQKMTTIEITRPSALEYKAGTYVNGIENNPMTTLNCGDAKFAWLELTDSFNKNGLNITLNKLTTESLEPKIPLMVQMSSYAYQMGMSKGLYIKGEESLVKTGMDMLVAHRITPMKSWAIPYSYYSGVYGLKEYVVNYSKQFTSVPMEGNLKTLSTDLTKYNVKNPWFYVVDEPDLSKPSSITDLTTTLNSLKTQAPNVARMVTTYYRKDLPVDIYVPVFEQLGVDGYPDASVYKANGKRLWAYISCMSHGNCYNNRAWNNGKVIESPIANRTGTPDLLIDAPSSDAFGFFMIAIKNNLEGLVYYNSIEQWGMDKSNANPPVKDWVSSDVVKDQFNFAGNGDGNFINPDYANKLSQGTYVLKMIREASYFADAIVMSGSQDMVSQYVTDTKHWNFNYAERENVYRKLK